MKLAFPPRGVLREFAIGFVCVFAALALPSPWLGPGYTKLHTWLGNAFVERATFVSGARLRFEASDEQLRAAPWTTTLRVAPTAHAQPVFIPINLRALAYLPTATFIALAVATPLASRRRNLRMLGTGLLILVPALLVLLSVPIVSFLGGSGPVTVFELGRWVHVVLQIVYRSLVVPPGMGYALPLLLWWLLVNRVTGTRSSGA